MELVNGNANHHLVIGFCVHKGIRSAFERVEFLSGRLLYIKLRGRWCDVIVLNLRAPTEDKSGDTRGTAVCIGSVPEVPHENFVTRFQCKGRERICSKSNRRK